MPLRALLAKQSLPLFSKEIALYPVLVGPCPGRTRPGQDKGGQYRVAKNAPRNDTKPIQNDFYTLSHYAIFSDKLQNYQQFHLPTMPF